MDHKQTHESQGHSKVFLGLDVFAFLLIKRNSETGSRAKQKASGNAASQSGLKLPGAGADMAAP